MVRSGIAGKGARIILILNSKINLAIANIIFTSVSAAAGAAGKPY